MSTTLSSRPLTIKQRSIDATRRLREVLKLDDLTVLATALAEAAADEATHNHTFADRVRSAYEDIEKLKTPKRTQSGGTTRHLVPIVKIDDLGFDPFATTDPYFLVKTYGAHQLHDALDGYSLARLKEVAAVVEQRNPGTKPANRSRKDSVLAYIIEQVTGATN